MSRTFEEMRSEALALTSEERGHLAEELLDSVESDDGIEWDDQYAAEIQRRVAEVRAGTAKMVSAEEAIAAARRAIRDEYAAEIRRRVAEIDAGTAETVDSDEAVANVRRLLNHARQTNVDTR